MNDWIIPLLGAGGLSALPQPLTKLIEVIANGTGKVYKPIGTVVEAYADAKAEIIRAKASEDIKDLKAIRVAERVEWRELRRQDNIENVTKIAYDNLPDKVSEEKVDEDWTVQFFNYSQDIGNEEMQMIWGKILAGEITQPGTFSLQTLSIVKILCQKDALILRKLCDFVWSGRFILRENILNNYFVSKGISFFGVFQLENLGLLKTHIPLNISEGQPREISYFGDKYVFALKTPSNIGMIIPAYILTQSGIELSSICESKADKKYISILTEYYSHDEYISMTKVKS